MIEKPHPSVVRRAIACLGSTAVFWIVAIGLLPHLWRTEAGTPAQRILSWIMVAIAVVSSAIAAVLYPDLDAYLSYRESRRDEPSTHDQRRG